MRFRLSLFFFLALSLPNWLLAQADTSRFSNSRGVVDTAMSAFAEKQKQMMDLLDRQIPRLIGLQQKVAATEASVYGIDSLFKLPKNIPAARDSAMNVLIRVRKANDNSRSQLREMHFAWFAYTLDIMAVYTRYGELMTLRKDDATLKRFYGRFREHYRLMADLLKRTDDVYQTSEYLLNSKLN